MTIDVSKIPVVLKERSQWVAWKLQELVKGKKPTKIPMNPAGGYAKSDDPKTWGTFEAVINCLNNGKKLSGIGFVVNYNDPFTGFDLDHCRNAETSIIEPWAMEEIRGLNSYTEITPSGTGIRIFAEGCLNDRGRKKGNVEAYSSHHFLTVTGNHLEGTPTTIEPRQAEIDSFYEKYFLKDEPHEKGIAKLNQTPSVSDQELIEKISQSKNGDKFQELMEGDFSNYPSQSEADLALCSILAFWTGNDPAQMNSLFRQSKFMRDKWDEKHGALTYGEMTINKAIEGTTELYKGNEIEIRKEVVTSEIVRLEFPRENIGGVAGQFADLYSTYFESPWSFFVFAFLTCLGNLIADRVTLASGIEPQPRFYTMNLGKSSDDRKSESIKRTIRFFLDTFAPGEFKICYGAGSAEGLARKFNEIANGPRKIILVYDEAQAFVSKARIEGSTLTSAVNTFFESNRFHSTTKHTLIEIENAYLSFLAASTTETFLRMWTPDFLDIGFINRLWLVYDHAERRFSIPREIPDSELQPIRKKLSEILNDIPLSGFKLDIDDEARKIFDDWYLSEESHRSPLTKRLDQYGLRLMIILAINQGATSVTARIAKNVIELLRWQLQVRRECDVIDAETNTAKVEELIRRSLKKGPLNPRDLKRMVHYNRYGLNIFQFAIDNLTKAEEIFFDRKEKLYCLQYEI